MCHAEDPSQQNKIHVEYIGEIDFFSVIQSHINFRN